MFTGLIETKGIITRTERVAGGMRLEVYAPDFGRDMAIGDSVAVDGACVTRNWGGCQGNGNRFVTLAVGSVSKDGGTPSTRGEGVSSSCGTSTDALIGDSCAFTESVSTETTDAPAASAGGFD